MNDKVTVTFFLIINTYIAGACHSPTPPPSPPCVFWELKSTITLKPLWQELPKSFILDVAEDCLESFIVHSFTQILHLFFWRFKTWEMRGIISSCDLEFSAISPMVSLNQCTNIFTQRILKWYIPQEVEKNYQSV